jgi:hypothetical protein
MRKNAIAVGFSRQIWYISELQLNHSGKAEQIETGNIKFRRGIMCKKPYFLISYVLALALCLVSSTFVQARDKPITLDTDPNLAGWWKLDEVSGKTAADSSKHNRKGTLKEDISFEKDSASGRVGKALKFGRGDGYIQITKYKGVTGTRPRTVTAWIKTTESNGEILSWGLDDYGKIFTFGFIRGRERIGVTPNGGYLYINEETDDDQWHHVAAVVEEAELPNLHDDVKLYKDGEPAEIHDIGLLDLWPIDTGSDLDVRIGRGFKGLIDDVRIYDRALSEDEINALYKLQSNKPLPK